MKKSCIGLLIFFISSFLLPNDNIKIGAYAGYFSVRDNAIKEVYTNGDVTYGARLGVRIWKGLHIWVSGGQFRKVSETTLLADTTTLVLNPFTLSLRYVFPLGTVNPYIGGGYTYIYFKEKSDIGDVSGDGRGYSMDTGIEFKLSQRFRLDLGVSYSQAKVNPTGHDVEIGGLQAGLAFLVVF